MYKKQLTKFFNENPITDKNPSAAALGSFLIKMARDEDSAKLESILKKVDLELPPERRAKLAEIMAKVEAASTSQQMIKLMRGDLDLAAGRKLFEKARALESEIVPELVRMLKRSYNDGFIEVATKFLAIADTNVSEELIADFDQIRNPYAQSSTLLMLGFTADEKHVPWFIDKYHELKRLYPDERFHEGAFFGLDGVWCRFYAV